MEQDVSPFSLFENTSVPVLICRENGTVIYKNAAAVRFLPTIRKRANAFARAEQTDFLSAVRDGRPGVIRFPDEPSLKRALVFSLTTEEETVFPLLFFSRLQFGDYAGIVAAARETLSSDFLACFAADGRTDLPVGTGASAPVRLFGELGERLCKDGMTRGAARLFDVGDFLLRVKNRVTGPLAVLGYRLTFSPTELFLENRFASLDPSGFSYFFSRSLYAILLHSRSRHAEIKADWDGRSVVLSIQTDADLPGGEVLSFDSLVPEYAWETVLLRSLPSFSEPFSFTEKDGVLSVESLLPSPVASSFCEVRAVGLPVSFAGADVMADMLLSLLKNRIRIPG